MSREFTHSLQNPIAIKSKPRPNNCRLLAVLFLAAFAASIYYITTQPSLKSLGNPSDQFVVKNIPKTYTRLDALDPDERGIFEGFKTSFLPPEELILTRKGPHSKSEVYEGNVTSDILLWGNSGDKDTPTRVKRKSHFMFTSQDYDARKIHRNTNMDEINEKDYEDDDDSKIEDDYEGDDQYEDIGHTDRIVHPEPHMDRGPLDDVVEQVRGQPELEEGEMGIISRIPNPHRYYSGIHAFWKGQGDQETIRHTQANIMKQYMDAGADPCQDFYQYACGNWATLNPIPADKAGYDTFEMLRENLDTVLKELLEFKPNEVVGSTFPGKHLDLEENFLNVPELGNYDSIVGGNCTLKILRTKQKGSVKKQNNTRPTQVTSKLTPHAPKENVHKPHTPVSQDIAAPAQPPSLPDFMKQLLKDFKVMENLSLGILNNTNLPSHRYDVGSTNDKKWDVASRIRRYLDTKVNKSTKLKDQIKLHFKNMVSKRKINKKRNQQNYVSQKIDKRIRFNKRRLQMYRRNFKKRTIRGIDSSKNVAKVEVAVERSELSRVDQSHGDAALKARFLFKSCMNYNILQNRGHQPLLDMLELLGGWPILNSRWDGLKFDWIDLMAKLRLYNNDILISEWVGPDIKNSDEFVIQFDQTSLGLPTRDYFLQDSNKVYLDAYRNYLVKIAELLGGHPVHVKKSAAELIEFEKRLAKITSAPEDRRNVSELYQRMPLQKLENLVPEIHWKRYLCVVMNRTVKPEETVVLFALNYVRNLVQLVNHTEPHILSNYLLWRFVRHRVNNLDDRFQNAKQEFYYTLFGREQAPPRWKNCISQVNSNMGMALGSMFVRKYFDETSKNDTLTMTRDIQKSFKELLNLTDWIDDDTKKLAAHKVDAMMLRIGYPDFILKKEELDDRYKEVKIHPDKYFENILNILLHLTKMEQSRLGQPVNKTLWNTAPAVVNAYYSRNKNQIMFPAGILQPPFYHRHFPRSLNYGGIGVVIGHEITHGFDDKGRLFDCNGNLHRWWSDSAIAAFHRRAQCLIDQYGQYMVPEVHMKLDGVNTQGENIADNGGVKQAFRAYLHWLSKHNNKDDTLPGLNHTHTQLFFLNFAQVWCGAMRPEAMRNKLKTAVHSPGRFRVIGTLSNSHDFAREFRCPPGSPMNPTHKCTVW